VRADEKLTAFLELEVAIFSALNKSSGGQPRAGGDGGPCSGIFAFRPKKIIMAHHDDKEEARVAQSTRTFAATRRVRYASGFRYVSRLRQRHAESGGHLSAQLAVNHLQVQSVFIAMDNHAREHAPGSKKEG
jgi:hypothetical protein